jgi:hypothetical protein
MPHPAVNATSRKRLAYNLSTDAFFGRDVIRARIGGHAGGTADGYAHGACSAECRSRSALYAAGGPAKQCSCRYRTVFGN